MRSCGVRTEEEQQLAAFVCSLPARVSSQEPLGTSCQDRHCPPSPDPTPSFHRRYGSARASIQSLPITSCIRWPNAQFHFVFVTADDGPLISIRLLWWDSGWHDVMPSPTHPRQFTETQTTPTHAPFLPRRVSLAGPRLIEEKNLETEGFFLIHNLPTSPESAACPVSVCLSVCPTVPTVACVC
ncbi:hypothetical protein BCR34DRAFT_161755 [Clohesyomyces aquaticus]|uniref:Uncharacterized protein n=1 Tax=Clohesyomyces aquaticus TaxID=1231657 RepID=A0A1Y1ZZL4_9PLEO|nr:hypothetical protein BCR34DRAFT_161755 [Clohesyomyces aquaticus]